VKNQYSRKSGRDANVGEEYRRQEAEGRRQGQETEDRGQKAGDRRQEAEGRKQETGDRRQETGGRRQEAEDRGQKAGSRRQKAGGRRQEAEDRSRSGSVQVEFLHFVTQRVAGDSQHNGGAGFGTVQPPMLNRRRGAVRLVFSLVCRIPAGSDNVMRRKRLKRVKIVQELAPRLGKFRCRESNAPARPRR
jgi:hypothetical protein